MIKKHIFLYLICVYNVQKIKYYWSRIELTQYNLNAFGTHIRNL